MVGRVFSFTEPADYPEVAELFRFAKKRLQALYPEKKIKAIDVGRLLDFDYKYTHQFSHGKMRVFNVRYINNLSAKLDVPVDIIVRILRRDLRTEKALDWCQRRSQGEPVDVEASGDQWDLKLSGRILKPETITSGLQVSLEGLWAQAGKIVNSPERLREFMGRYAGGAPADKAVVERLKKPKLALSRKGK